MEQRLVSGGSKLIEQTLIFCKLFYRGFILGESESVLTVFSRFFLDHIISKVGELFVLFAYHSINDY